MLEVMYNVEYGGYSFSKKALDEYNDIKSSADPNHITEKYGFNIDRTDPVMISIVKKLGNEANNSFHSDIVIEEIPLIYKNYYEIKEYDGLEEIIIKKNKYKVDMIRKIMNSGNEKLIEIQKILDL